MIPEPNTYINEYINTTKQSYQAAGDNGLQLLGPDSSVDRSLAHSILRLSSCPA